MLKLRDKNLLLGVKATTPKNDDVVVSMEKPQCYIDTKLNNKCDSDRTTFIMRTPQIVEYARVRLDNTSNAQGTSSTTVTKNPLNLIRTYPDS